MGEAEHGGVGHLVELVANGGVDARMVVAVNVAPQRGDAVDVAAPGGVDEVRALGTFHDHGLFLGPPALLGERMPEAVPVICDELRVSLRAYVHRGRP